MLIYPWTDPLKWNNKRLQHSSRKGVREWLNAARYYALKSKSTIGFGLGASAAAGVNLEGLHLGTGAAVSNMLVADGNGETALVTTYTYNTLSGQSGGIAANAGLQVSLGHSNLSAGFSGNLSGGASGGGGLGAGINVNNAGTVTLNVGVSLGAKITAGISNIDASYTQMICPE